MWFCRLGKTNLKINSILNDSGLIFIRDSKRNGGKFYVAFVSDISRAAPKTCFPKYYDLICKDKALWFKINSIKEIDGKIINKCFSSSSSGRTVDEACRSMCSAFYITANRTIENL